ncbi:MAG: glycoside hydrolase family 3 N-terminal domain-containing protein [Planctomycetota bacterium]
MRTRLTATLGSILILGTLVPISCAPAHETRRAQPSDAQAAPDSAASDSAPSVASASSARVRGKPMLSPAQWQRIDRLIASMTLREKAGQMVQMTLGTMTSQVSSAGGPAVLDLELAREAIVENGIGSILNTAWVAMEPGPWRTIVAEVQRIAREETPHGIPLLYGIDSVHGANYITGATLFPHNLTLAATWNPELARRSGAVAAADSRAVGLNWNFAPVGDIGRAPSWSRVFETFGEDPHLAAMMASAAIDGMQGQDLASDTSVAATAKHFLGYGDPRTGRDRTPAIISPSDLREIHIPPFEAAFDVGVRTIMVNSGEINGVPVHADRRILTDLLRDTMGFEGVVVTDWRDVEKLVDMHAVAKDEREATFLAVRAGIDMSMTPMDAEFADHVVALVEEGRLTEKRIDESVRRILALKVELGLFERTLPPGEAVAAIGSAESQAISLNAAREGITLLRNFSGVLPLAEGSRILVTGPTSNELMSLHGAWSYSWQGNESDLFPDSPTIADAIRSRFGESNVTHLPGATFDAVGDLDALLEAAASSDVVVLCLGEPPSTEEPGDIDDLTISAAQIELAEALAASGTPVVLVLITNRPRIITAFEAGMAGIVWAGHPGPFGPQALAEIMAGDVNPSGRLPFSYPKFPNALLTYDRKISETPGDADPPGGGYKPLFRFGTGLSYTTFGYSDLSLDLPTVREAGPQGPLRVRISVTNTGNRAGMDAVQVYLTDRFASVSPRAEELKAFRKVSLDPGETRTMIFDIPAREFFVADRDGRLVFEPGAFAIRVGDETAEFDLVPASSDR